MRVANFKDNTIAKKERHKIAWNKDTTLDCMKLRLLDVPDIFHEKREPYPNAFTEMQLELSSFHPAYVL